jgi:CubicO group peptidase (beta-lactamase class C family)
MRYAFIAIMAFPCQVSAGEFDGIDTYVRQKMKEIGIPGMAVAIVRDGHIVHLKGYGESDPGVSITPQTPFSLASVSKSFTAMAVMQLVEAGKVELDKPVRTYLTWFRLADDAAERITVRQLLNHTSGLSTYSGRKSFFARDLGQEAVEREVRDLSGERLTAAPGEKFQYSNSNFAIASALVSAVSGLPFEQYLRERIFVPLKMKHSFIGEADAKAHGLTTGYRFWFGSPFAAHDIPYSHRMLGAGGLFSTAEDLGQYVIASLGGENGKAVLSPIGFAELHRPSVKIGGDFHYGLGWDTVVRNGIRHVRHRGDMECFHADVMMVPEEKIGVVTLMNVNSPTKTIKLINVAEGVLGLARNKEPYVLKDDPLPTVIMYSVLVLIVVQSLWALRTIRLVRRWTRHPDSRPQRWKVVTGVILSLVLNVSLALIFFVLMPAFFEIPFVAGFLFAPDVAWVNAVCGGFAVVWAVVRNVLVLRS